LKKRQRQAQLSGLGGNTMTEVEEIVQGTRFDGIEERNSFALQLSQESPFETNSTPSCEIDPYSIEEGLYLDLAARPFQDLEFDDWLHQDFAFPIMSQSINALSNMSDGSERSYL
jgi:hypothetical protein